MGQVLLCRSCGNWYTGDYCQTCERETAEPVKPFKLSENDRKFLKSGKIKPEE